MVFWKKEVENDDVNKDAVFAQHLSEAAEFKRVWEDCYAWITLQHYSTYLKHLPRILVDAASVCVAEGDATCATHTSVAQRPCFDCPCFAGEIYASLFPDEDATEDFRTSRKMCRTNALSAFSEAHRVFMLAISTVEKHLETNKEDQAEQLFLRLLAVAGAYDRHGFIAAFRHPVCFAGVGMVCARIVEMMDREESGMGRS